MPTPQTSNTNCTTGTTTKGNSKAPLHPKREAVERRKARYEQAQLEYEAAEKKAAARKKLNARKPSAKRKRANGGNAANSTKEKTPPGKQNKPSAGKGAQNVDCDLLDDEDHDDDVNDDNPTNNEIDEDVLNGNDSIVGEAKDNDENKDDPSYHDDDEDSSSNSDSEPSMPPADFDTETKDAPVENGKDTDSSGRQRIYKKKRRDGDRRGVSTNSSHTATMSVQPITVVRTQTAATIPPGMDKLVRIRGMSRSESLKCRQKFVTQ